MACSVFRNDKGEITSVKAPNGEPSILYKDLNKIKDITSEESLHLWAETYTQSFNDFYEGEMDKNGEAVYNQAKDILNNLVDDIYYQQNIHAKLYDLAIKYVMNESGFMSPAINPQQVRIDLNNLGLGHVKVEKASSGSYFFRLRGSFYNPFRSNHNQVTSSEAPPDERLDAIARAFIAKVGGEVNFVGQLEHDSAARVNTLSKVIEVVESRQGMDTLTEEAIHLMIGMMRGSNSYNTMIANIKSFPEYQETVQEYGDLENYDQRKIEEESVVKLVTKLALEEFRNDNISKSWWNMILDFFRRVFSSKAVSEFRDSAKRFLDLNVSTLQNPKDIGDNTFYQKIKPNKEQFQYILSQIKEMNKLDIQRKNERYYIPALDKEVRFRVTDKVQDYARRLYGKREFAPEYRSFYTTKGTILHVYNQIIMESLIDNKKITHKAAEDIVFNTLKSQPEFKEFQNRKYYELTAQQWKTLLYGVQHLHESILSRDKGKPKIFTEQIIYDPKDGTNDIAGTVDLLVVYSDGTIGIYDYKSTKFYSTGGQYNELSDNKRQLYDIQLSRYREIMKNTWKLQDNSFRETRVIPINVQYHYTTTQDLKNQTFREIEMYKHALSPDYLKHISAAKELIPGDVELNIFLNKLYNERSRLRNEMQVTHGEQLKKARLRLRKINSTINDLIVSGEIESALEDIKSIVGEINAGLKDFNATQLLEYMDLIKLYESFNVAFRKSLKTIPKKDKKGKKVRAILQKKMSHYNNLIDIAKGDIGYQVLAKVQTYSDMDMSEGGKMKGTLGQLYDGIAEWNNPAVFTIGTILAEQREKVLRDLLKDDERINSVHDRYIKWAASKGKRGIRAFDFILRKKDRNLITRFVPEFYKEKDKRLAEGRERMHAGKDIRADAEWFEQHYHFDEERWEKGGESLKKWLSENAAYSAKDIKRELRKHAALNPNIRIKNKLNYGAWFAYKNGYIRPKDFTAEEQSEWVSPEWKFIHQKGNEAAKEYVDMYLGLIADIRSKVGYDTIAHNFVPNIHANSIEKIARLGFFKEGTIFPDWNRAMEIREYDHTFGTAANIDGKPLDKIPLLGLDRLKRDTISRREKADIELEVEMEFPRGSTEFLNEVDARISELKYEKGVLDKSTDLTKSLKIFLKSAYDYQYKSDIEDSILLIRRFVTLDHYTEVPTDKHDNPIMDYLTNTLQKRMGASTTTEEVIDKFTKMHLYGQRLQSKDPKFGGGKSVTKLVQLAQEFLSVKALGLNPILGGASFIGASLNKSIVAKKGLYFSEKSWSEAVSGLTSADEKTAAAIYFFEPSARDISYDRALKKSASTAVRSLNMRNWFAFHRGFINKRGSKRFGIDNPIFGDDNIDNTILIAMMKNWVITPEGRLKSKGDVFRKEDPDKLPTVWDNFFMKDGKMGVTGLNEKEFIRFRRIVAQAQNRVKGSMTEDQMHLASTQLTHQMLLKFRNWMPGLIRQKGAALRYNPLVETWEEGHFRTTFSELFPSRGLIQSEQEATATAIGTMFGDYIIPTIQNFVSISGEALSFGLWKYNIDEKKAEFFMHKFLRDNPNIKPEDFTLEQFVAFREKQIRAMATELRYVFAFLPLLLGALSMLGWDDDEENILTWNLYKLAKRSYLELSFFFSMESVNEILKSPLPVMRLLTDFWQMSENFVIESAELVGIGEPSNRDRTPLGYYTLKNLPGINQVLAVNAFFPTQKDKSLFERIFGESKGFEEYILSR